MLKSSKDAPYPSQYHSEELSLTLTGLEFWFFEVWINIKNFCLVLPSGGAQCQWALPPARSQGENIPRWGRGSQKIEGVGGKCPHSLRLHEVERVLHGNLPPTGRAYTSSPRQAFTKGVLFLEQL